MVRNLGDEVVVNAFVEHLKKHGYPLLKIDRIPEKENRNSDEIDAVAGPFAIEHTSIDTVPNQRRDSAWFLKVVGGLQSELSLRLRYRLRITLPCEGIRRGQDWAAIRESLVKWVFDSASKLPDGSHIIKNVPGIPFELHLNKASNRPPGLFFARFALEDKNFPVRLSAQLARKAKKLILYKEKGFTTVLLIESGDIALVNEGIMLDGIRNAFSGGLLKSVDQVWYVDTSIPEDLLFHDFTPII